MQVEAHHAKVLRDCDLSGQFRIADRDGDGRLNAVSRGLAFSSSVLHHILARYRVVVLLQIYFDVGTGCYCIVYFSPEEYLFM